MARQVINAGSTDNDPSAESVNSAFTKVNAMTLELFTANSLSGRQVIDLAGADTIRAAFIKWDQNSLTLYTALGLAGRVNINDGAFLDDPSAQSIRSAFQAINTMTATLYTSPGAGLYVALTGSDTTGTGTLAAPYRTISKAYAVASAGTTIIVRDGTYTDTVALGKSGTASQPITLRAENRLGATIDGQNTSSRQLAIACHGSYNILDGFIVTRGYEGGIGVYGHFNQFRHNEVHHNGYVPNTVNGQDGFYSDPASHDNVYYANHIHHNGRIGSGTIQDHGLYLCGDNELIANNVVVFNAAHGLQVAGYNTVSNMKVYNNVFAWNGHNGLMLWQALSNIEIKNNILYKNSGLGLDSYNAHGSGIVLDRNCAYQNSGGMYDFTQGGSDYSYSLQTNYTANPLFVADTTDFHLQSTSTLIHAGVTLPLASPDFDDVARPQGAGYDVGAYER